ncbi:MAG: IS4 family transposase [Anaerolineae bacterium]|jgi:hypothetical protein
MAWCEDVQLTERFRTAGALLKRTCKHWQLGSSYAGWAAAGRREAARMMPLIVRRLRLHMRAMTDHQRCGGWDAFAADGSQAACPRTLENQQAMGDVGKPDGIPQMSLTTILHLGTRLPWDFRVGPGTDSERAHLRDMLGDLPVGSLLVADAGFVGYDLCGVVIREKRHFLLRVGGNVHLLDGLGYERDADGQTVYLWPIHQQQQNEPPIRLRLIVVRDGSKQPVYLVTSVLDPAALSDDAAGEIYRTRWAIEVQYRTAKQTMHHHTMRSRTPETCYQEMTWAFLGVWLLQLMAMRKVIAAGGAPQDTSAARARDAVRRVMRNQPPGDSSRRTFAHELSRCRLDAYVRHRPKASRNYPRKKRHNAPSPPKIKPPDESQLQKAKQLTPIQMQL